MQSLCFGLTLIFVLQIDAWAQSNSIPGQFTGSTGAQILSSDELTNSGPQAWIRKVEVMQTYLSKYHILNISESIGTCQKCALKTYGNACVNYKRLS